MGKLGTNYVLLGIAMATILGVYAITTSAPTSLTATSTENMPYLLGHLEVTITDANGIIKSYQQTDNVLTDEGFACALTLLSGAPDGCTTPAAFKFISLADNSSSPIFTDTASAYTDEVAIAVGSPSLVTPTSFTITKAFTAEVTVGSDDLENTETVSQTGLFDSVSGGNMLAVAALSSTTVVTGDVVTVTWTISKP